MSLDVGTRLGPYEIVALLGAGGMGEVYQARDTRLDRTVAIKVLPAALSADPERRARFEREARAVAALSHPYICPLFDIGATSSPQAAGEQTIHYLVMEHLAGETLAAHLARGPLPLGQALETGAQMADALDAAHKHGIIHRDLKPGNVMLTTGGAGRSGVTVAKLLDFGLAKLAAHGERPALAAGASAPTAAAPVTAEGTILGTLQYMAPEQLEGKEADARTDLWALGAILYEMVTGTRAFAAKSQISLIGAIMHAEPAALSTLQPLTPPALEHVVTKCLGKHPDERWDSAHDLADELRWIAQVSRSAPDAKPARRRGVWMTAAAACALGVLVIGAAIGWFAARSASAPRPEATRSLIGVQPAERIESVPSSTRGGSRTALAITRDGRRIVFVGRSGNVGRLYVRNLDATAATELPGTIGAESPVFSPDGRWIAFWAEGSIKKTQADGGPVMLICPIPPSAGMPHGISWGDDGRIVFGLLRGGLMSVSSDGGTPAEVTKLQPGEVSHRLPFVMPGSKWVLFTVRRTAWLWGDEGVVAQSLETGERRSVMTGGTAARYVPTGHLLCLQLGTLMARAFDVKTHAVRGAAVALVEQVAQALDSDTGEGGVTGAGQYAVSHTGTLVYLAGSIPVRRTAEFVTFDRQGAVSTLPSDPAPYNSGPTLSPDGRTVAMPTREMNGYGLWLVNVSRGTRTRIASEGEIWWPKWTPDGRRVAFLWRARGVMSVGWVATDSASPPEPLVTADALGSLAPLLWSPDGKVLAVAVLQPRGDRDIAILSLDRPGDGLRPLVSTEANEVNAAFSPDGKWLAYESNETGRDEVYVLAYPPAGRNTLVSPAGGRNPAWNPNGRELFYVSEPDRDGKRWFMSTAFTAQPRPSFGRPRPLAPAPFSPASPGNAYDVFPSGDRFLALRPLPVPPPAPVTEMNLVTNWFEELAAKVPVR